MRKGYDNRVYLNPEFDELMELVSERWDTVRILLAHDDSWIALASGYGHTHSSITNAIRDGRKFRAGCPFILYHESQWCFFNCCDAGGGERVEAYKAVVEYFNEPHRGLLKDLIRESGYAI